MRQFKLSKMIIGLMILIAGFGCHALAQLPLQPGEAVATCYAGPDGFSLGVFDIRDPAAHATYNTNWAGIGSHYLNWGRDFDSEVFGLALDDAPNPNIYVTSTTCYTSVYNPVTRPGNGKVYKINGTNGLTSVFATLPNVSSGLGNIAFDARHRQFYVTNFHDGFIYTLSMTGVITGTYDPGPIYNPSLSVKDFVPLGDRPWGINVFDNRVYFSIWSNDRRNTHNPNVIYSVGLDANGAFIPGQQKEIIPTPFGSDGWNMPVADIAFSLDGRMLLAERGMSADAYANPHEARVLEYSGGPSNWSLTGSQFKVGLHAGTNASGGVAYNCVTDKPAYVVATGDYLGDYLGIWIYGLQIFPDTGGSLTNSYLVDINDYTAFYDKTEIGDVEVYNNCNPCLEITDEKILCTTDGSGDFIWNFRVRNLSGFSAQHLFITNLPGATASPDYFPLGNVFPGNKSGNLQVRISGASPSSIQAISFSMHNDDLALCCLADYEIQIPDCKCAQILKKQVRATPSGYSFSFYLQNLAPTSVDYILTVPVTPGITLSQSFQPIGSLAYAGITQLTLGISGPAALPGKEICLRISTHDAEFRKCCSIVYCITLPPKIIGPFDPTLTDLGEARARETDTGILVEHIGASGRDGVEFLLQDDAVGLHLALADLPETGSEGAFVTLSATGTSYSEDRSLGSLRVTDKGQYLNVAADFSALESTTQSLQFFRDDILIREFHDWAGPVRDICFWPTLFAVGLRYVDGSPTICYDLTWPNLESFQLTDGETIEANRLQICPNSPLAEVASISSLSLKAAKIDTIQILSAEVSFDCNENGIADDDEITRGLVSDYNRNGVPDTCEDLVPGKVFNLNTGFNQVKGETLEPGSTDDDWRIITPGLEGPARLVITRNSAWPTPFAQSEWLSVNSDTGSSVADVTQISYVYRFCLSEATTYALLDLALFADDIASIQLNNQPLTAEIGAFNGGSPGTMLYGALIEDGLFKHGENTLRIDVQDTHRVVTGFNLIGTVKTDGPGCN